MSIDTRDQIDWNSQILQEISYFAGILLFLSRNSKVEKITYCEKYSLWRATCNCQFSLSCLQPSDISSHSQDRYHSSYYPRGKCFLWTLFFLGNLIREILDFPCRINVCFWCAVHTSALISKSTEKALLQTSLYCFPPPLPPRQKFLARALHAH